MGRRAILALNGLPMCVFPSRRSPARSLRALGFAVVSIAGLASAALADDSHAVLHTRKGSFTFNIEVVDTEAGRERGLMDRKSLAPDAGMLFDFLTPQPVAFWMKDTLIPLDMVFIARDGVVKSIHADAKPLDLTPIPSDGPVQFVLEIAGGRAAAIGLAPGDRMDEARVKPDQ
jgi:uncharacterized membrane protein (UPF0127 family)